MRHDWLHRLIYGQVCKGCKKRRRIRWFSDTGCCTYGCLIVALDRLEGPCSVSDLRGFR